MEKVKNESLEEVSNFLSCYFHQDYDSMESAYEELLNEESRQILNISGSSSEKLY
ncbi:contact-dependent growth inhibition system immunity protein [Bacillus amyloliquefaciens]|uniref:contact-dependent growth inhibition system immunity protein n=1 Tax=Bacillus amyloliquefaciens TaxID=1390 RepID=UPI0008273A13|nr:hypothetical protein BARD7_00266 [Bacillus amyloliquefaciens]